MKVGTDGVWSGPTGMMRVADDGGSGHGGDAGPWPTPRGRTPVVRIEEERNGERFLVGQ